MKVKTILFSALCAGFLTLGVTGCFTRSGSKSSSDNKQSSNPTSQESSSETSQQQSESSSEKEKVPGDENWVDYVNNGSVKLGLDYQGKDFYVDGIGQFDLKTPIDGDTAHFTPLVDSLNKGLMKARFYGIDTPESTGKVQEWGKEASNFTKEKLKEAQANGTIVVSSPQNEYGTPDPDSTGSRYVSLVWINLTKKNAPYDELVLLNLWIVQEGLSWVKNVQDMPQYVDTFYDAEDQAKEYKLCLHSALPAPGFNYGDYHTTSLLDIKYELQQSLDNPDHENLYDNEKIRIQGTVSGYSNHILYLQDYVLYDKDNPALGGEYCGINIFVGMTSISTKYTKLNTFIQVCGLAQYTENYGFQVTDTQGRFPVGSATNEADAQVIYTPAENAETEHNLYTFKYTTSQLSAIASAKNPYNLDCLNCSVAVTEELTVNRVFINNSDNQEITLYFTGASFNCYIPFNYKGNPDKPTERWVTEEKFLNQKFLLTGVYVLHKTQSGNINFQIIPNDSSGLVWINPELA